MSEHLKLIPKGMCFIAYFKIVRRSFCWINFPILHYTVHDFEEIIGSRDSGGEIERDFWPPVVLLTNNYTFHGHSGKPIPVGADEAEPLDPLPDFLFSL